MKIIKLVLIVAAVVISTNLSALESIVTGKWFEIHSQTMNENRRYSIYLPPGYQQNKDKKYPVMYVFDGDETRMKGISGLVESLGSENLDRQIPEFIIVAIPNTDRTRDLTPTKTDLIFKGNVLDKFEASGGADKFAAFIEKELVPSIRSKYRTNGTKVLVGHSFGGLFAAHVMLTNPDLFSHYLIADATFIWDNNYLNKLAHKKLSQFPPNKIKVFFALANNDHLGEIGITNRAWGNQFITQLKKSSSTNLQVDSKYFVDERHATVEMLAWYYGLRYLFKARQTES
ncbi:alpha/beta hydrolase [Aliikangiella coralliicola]|uniref:Alpha/beta hydrolase n=1 Tax=Aliikangiella coralliicola TaxID=2592383 RepID=A0A545UF61_9GAMM|nr:alpha/beta hydrolase-fold protein [Aliikangiella coralliicola]TQV88112.1 alpha/beta hydrolase [Aliikangiella coralliicola]